MKAIYTLFIALALCLCGCGDVNTYKTPPAPPPVASSTVDFTCMSVDNDQTCTGIETAPGVWASGPVSIPGTPTPLDYINVEVTNNSPTDVSIFVYSLVTISGCGDNPIAFDVVDMAAGASVAFTYQLWNRVCGMLGPQETVVSIYNAAGFDPADYAPFPKSYPRTDHITSSTVKWENVLP